tara:strand:- start:92 stop:220 length:129 start_codon:yes stop_codon:yes gene_type:complete
VTVLFDMFFTVILFKHFYSKLVRRFPRPPSLSDRAPPPRLSP